MAYYGGLQVILTGLTTSTDHPSRPMALVSMAAMALTKSSS